MDGWSDRGMDGWDGWVCSGMSLGLSLGERVVWLVNYLVVLKESCWSKLSWCLYSFAVQKITFIVC